MLFVVGKLIFCCIRENQRVDAGELVEEVKSQESPA